MGFVLYCPDCGKYTGTPESPVCADCKVNAELERVRNIAWKVATQTNSKLIDCKVTDDGYEIKWRAENDSLDLGCGVSFVEAADSVSLAITLMYWFYQSLQLWHMIEKDEA